MEKDSVRLQTLAGLMVMVLWTAAYGSAGAWRPKKPAPKRSEKASVSAQKNPKPEGACEHLRLSGASCLEQWGDPFFSRLKPK